MEVNFDKEMLTALTVSLQTVFDTYVTYEKCVLVAGQLYLTVDTAPPQSLIINELICKTNENGDISPLFESKSSFSSEKHLDNKSLKRDFYTTDTTQNHDVNSIHGDTNIHISNVEQVKLESHELIQLSDSLNDSKLGENIESILDNEIYLQSFMSAAEENEEDDYLKQDKPTTKKQSHCRKLKKNKSQTILPCSYCGRPFLSKQLLKCHEDSHLNKKTYSCQQCGSSFRYKKDLKSHRIRRHQADGFQVVVYFFNQAISLSIYLLFQCISEGITLSGTCLAASGFQTRSYSNCGFNFLY